MTGCIQIRAPRDCSDTQRGEFIALVRKGEEVTPDGLEKRVMSAAALIFMRAEDGQLIGIAAMKHPNDSYRKRISKKSGVWLEPKMWPNELGWAYVEEEWRGKKLSRDLVGAALNWAEEVGVFSTSRAENERMHGTLSRFGFVGKGQSYLSERGDYHLKLFVRDKPA